VTVTSGQGGRGPGHLGSRTLLHEFKGERGGARLSRCGRLRFEGFNYEIPVDGGMSHLEMTPATGGGKVTVKAPGQLDAVLLTSDPSKDHGKDAKASSHGKGQGGGGKSTN